MKKIIISLFLVLTLSFIIKTPIIYAEKTETSDDVVLLVEELKTILRKAEDVIKKIKEDKGVPAEKLPLDHQYAPKEMLENLNELIIEAKEILEKEDKTEEELKEIIILMEDSIDLITENTIVGTKKSEYRDLILKIGGTLIVLIIVGGITLLVLYKKQKA